MKKLLFLTLSGLFFTSCGQEVKPDPEVHYINVNAKIIDMGSEDGITDDKHHDAINVKTVLIQLVKNPTQHAELVSSNYSTPRRWEVETEWYYNHKVGDIIHFDYILKSRFFTIKN